MPLLKLVEKNDPYRFLKLGLWAYFFLLIFEGALRKWLLPGLSAPLLVVRDPLALWLLITALRQGKFPQISYSNTFIALGIIGMGTALIWGHGNLAVAAFGARILLLHFPLIFVMGNVFDREDVVRMGKATLLIAIPMTILIALQFYSPQSAWVNRGVGGDLEGAGFRGAMGFYRPPGTFSFTNGNSLFYSMVGCFLIYFWLNPGEIKKILLIAATACLLVAVPLSISRTLFFSVGISVVFAVFTILQKPQYITQLIVGGVGIVMVLLVLSQVEIFQSATEVFTARFTNASNTEGGLEGTLVERYLGGLIASVTETGNLPFLGYGMGLGTNVGSMLLTGERSFLISEGEWGRLIGEMGVLMGLAIIIIRLALCGHIFLLSLKKLQMGDVLPWMLLSFGLLIVPQGQCAQPTALGFCTIMGGLMIASLQRQKVELETKS
ncbi:hypothetical protein RM545_06165 [Zunongwangia sp. F260]|uniref:Uncharacterized protein n=1 Tax=Autumnicola lenta TaxID=3075593 RepID=A0ABU3CIT3_9FLAO|nr:hypothetical protein [Zunongwangia sp. F260]MDT0646268.1 hypothetical protein [Zunongwangia sp. F260]